MIHGSLSTEQGNLSIWESGSTSRPGCINQDQWLLHEWDGQLRCAVIDGVTPTQSAPSFHAADSATYAGSVIRSCLRSPLPLQSALELANDRIHRPDLHVRDRPAASVVAVDIRPGSVSLVAAADGEAWILTDGIWTQIFDEDMLGEGVRQRLTDWIRQHPRSTLAERQGAEAEIVGVPEDWAYPPIGRFAHTLTRSYESALPQALILASDGAGLSAERCSTLDDWLPRLEQQDHVDDFAVIRFLTQETHDR